MRALTYCAAEEVLLGGGIVITDRAARFKPLVTDSPMPRPALLVDGNLQVVWADSEGFPAAWMCIFIPG